MHFWWEKEQKSDGRNGRNHPQNKFMVTDLSLAMGLTMPMNLPLSYVASLELLKSKLSIEISITLHRMATEKAD